MADLRFDGRVAVVTGAGRGLGRAHALLLAARGANVVVNDIGAAADGTGASPAPADRVVAEIRAHGGEAVADANTVETPEGAEAIVATALRAFGRVDVVVNNAGITDAAWHKTVDVHLHGTFHVTRAAWRYLCGQGYGRIVNTVSNAGLLGHVFDDAEDALDQFAYGTAKMGVVGLTKNLALHGRGRGVKVNAIAPIAYTRLTAAVTSGGFARWMEGTCTPERVSPVVAWLAHEDCPISGETLSVGGGRVARFFVAQTRGITMADPTPEDVRDGASSILDDGDHVVAADASEEIALYVRALGREPR